MQQVFLKINGSMLLIRYVGVLGSGSIFRLNVAQDQSSTTHVWVDSGRPYYVTRLVAGCLVMLKHALILNFGYKDSKITLNPPKPNL